MKKLISAVLAAAMVLALASCGSSSSSSGGTSSGGTSSGTGSSTSAPAGSGSVSGSGSTSTSGSGSEASSSPSVDLDWPKQPVNIMCPAAAGGGTDNILRLMNDYFVQKTGQSFVISNVTGITGYETTHNANTDGYDFICGTTTIFTSLLDGSLDYDWEDYAMVMFQDAPNMTAIVVRADSPYETLNDLLDAAKEDPSSVTGGITMSGQPYMTALALQDAIGYELYLADVGNTGERNAALLGGQVDWILTNTSTADPYVQSGDFRILAVCGDERYPMNPDVPTCKECGIDFTFPAQPIVWLAPKGTPDEACQAFNQIITEISNDENFINDMATKLNAVANKPHTIEESITMAQEYKETLAPYVK